MAPRDPAQSQASLCLGTTTALTALVMAHIQQLQLEVRCHSCDAVITITVIATITVHYHSGNSQSNRMTQQLEPCCIVICVFNGTCHHTVSCIVYSCKSLLPGTNIVRGSGQVNTMHACTKASMHNLAAFTGLCLVLLARKSRMHERCLRKVSRTCYIAFGCCALLRLIA